MFRIWRDSRSPEKTWLIAGLALSLCAVAAGQTEAPLDLSPYDALHHENMWDLDELYQTPETFPAEGMEAAGVTPIFYEGPPCKGKETRVFAWYGFPKRKVGEKVPAMVLIHGGGGTAFAEWVRIWNEQGYAAIAMDTAGNIPDVESEEKGNPKHRHAHGGPPGWGNFGQLADDPKDQWTYHAVSAAIWGHSLLRSFPEVDPDRSGVTGISWGGYLTSIVAGLDDRFQFAVPVYGCGYYGESSLYVTRLQQLGTANAKKWLTLWDPAHYLQRARMPMLWVTGTNDKHFPMHCLQKSYRLPQSPRTLCIRVNMRHSHVHGWAPLEICAYADQKLKGGLPLPEIVEASQKDGVALIRHSSSRPIKTVQFNYTTDDGEPSERKWHIVDVTPDADLKRVSHHIPAETTMYYFNVIDDRGFLVSSEHVEMD